MALTLTDPAGGPRIELLGRRKRVTKLVAFDSSYDLGGESLTPAMFGLTVIDEIQTFPTTGGYQFEWDSTNAKLKLRAQVTDLTETLTKAGFTDGGSTSGFMDFTGTIPLGSIITGWRSNTTVAWSGDTSAVLQLGVSGDVDRFTADTTSSVFATGVDGSNALAADAADGIAAAVTPRATVTTGSDFGLANANASTTVSILYVPPSLPGSDFSTLVSAARVSALGY